MREQNMHTPRPSTARACVPSRPSAVVNAEFYRPPNGATPIADLASLPATVPYRWGYAAPPAASGAQAAVPLTTESAPSVAMFAWYAEHAPVALTHGITRMMRHHTLLDLHGADSELGGLGGGGKETAGLGGARPADGVGCTGEGGLCAEHSHAAAAQEHLSSSASDASTPPRAHDLFLWVDVHRALAEGVAFYALARGGLVCDGCDGDGRLPAKFIYLAIELKDGLELSLPQVRLIERLFPNSARVELSRGYGTAHDLVCDPHPAAGPSGPSGPSGACLVPPLLHHHSNASSAGSGLYVDRRTPRPPSASLSAASNGSNGSTREAPPALSSMPPRASFDGSRGNILATDRI